MNIAPGAVPASEETADEAVEVGHCRALGITVVECVLMWTDYAGGPWWFARSPASVTHATLGPAGVLRPSEQRTHPTVVPELRADVPATQYAGAVAPLVGEGAARSPELKFFTEEAVEVSRILLEASRLQRSAP